MKTCIFDFDGTLVDSFPLVWEGFELAVRSTGEEFDPEEIKKHFGAPEDQIFSSVLGPEKGERAMAYWVVYSQDQLARLLPFPGIESSLQMLMGNGIKLGLFTGRSRETTDLILDHLGWNSFFDSVVTGTETSVPKPSPIGLEETLRRMNAKAPSSVYVGDTVKDIASAKGAAVYSVAALWDPRADAAALEKAGPHRVLHRPEDLALLFESSDRMGI